MRTLLVLVYSASSCALGGCGWLIGGDWDGTARATADDGGGAEGSSGDGQPGGPPGDGATGADGDDARTGDDAGPGTKPAQKLVPGGTLTYATTYGSATGRITHDFYVDVDEVTVGQFREWVKAGKPPPCAGPSACALEPNGPYAGTMFWDPGANANVQTDDQKTCEGDDAKVGPTSARADDRLPLNCISWYQAVALCHYRHARLLTEIEWYDVAIRSGGVYPWGSSAPSDCTQSTFGLAPDGGAPQNGCGFPRPVESASGDLSFDQLYDVGGSLSEWVWASPVLDFKGPPDPMPDDWTGPVTSAYQRVARGGHFMSAPGGLATSAGPTAPFLDRPYATVGLRCARTKL